METMKGSPHHHINKDVKDDANNNNNNYSININNDKYINTSPQIMFITFPLNIYYFQYLYLQTCDIYMQPNPFSSQKYIREDDEEKIMYYK